MASSPLRARRTACCTAVAAVAVTIAVVLVLLASGGASASTSGGGTGGGASASTGGGGNAGTGAATAHRRWWHLPAKPTWYWQLQGKLDLGQAAQLVDVDGFDTPPAEVAALHAAGRHVICYVDVGTWERWRPDARDFPASLLGGPNGWPGERWLDIRQLGTLEPIMTRRMAMCAQKGFDAVEPDNIDPLGNHPGFDLTRAEVIRYARWVAGEAHRLGLAVLQKNGPELVGALEPDFDGALVEQCNQYAECGQFSPYVRAHKPVLDAEYDARLYPGFCAADRREGIQGALYDLALDGRRYRPCPARPV